VQFNKKKELEYKPNLTGILSLYGRLIKSKQISVKDAVEAINKSRILRMTNAAIKSCGEIKLTEGNLREDLLHEGTTFLMYGSTKHLLAKLDEYIEHNPNSFEAQQMILIMTTKAKELAREKTPTPDKLVKVAEDMYRQASDIQIGNSSPSFHYFF
jgi:hypothetical protein